MIKYSSDMPGLDIYCADSVICYMLDLFNEFGTISCRTLICLPEGERDLRLWAFGDVVAIPDIALAFNMPFDRSTQRAAAIIQKFSGLSFAFSAALATTVTVMDAVVENQSHHFDTDTNLADIEGFSLERLFRGLIELPF